MGVSVHVRALVNLLSVCVCPSACISVCMLVHACACMGTGTYTNTSPCAHTHASLHRPVECVHMWLFTSVKRALNLF